MPENYTITAIEIFGVTVKIRNPFAISFYSDPKYNLPPHK